MRASPVSSETSTSSDAGENEAAVQAAIVRAALNGPLQECQRLLRKHPDARESFAVQIVLGDEKGALAALAKDPALARRAIGANAREPIALLCFSLYQNAEGEDPSGGSPADFVAILNRLLELGADPNAYLSSGSSDHGGHEHRSPILFGCLGHAYNPLAAAALLKAGANANDGESLYHAAERVDGEGLRLLFENGAKLAGTNALKRKLDFDHFESFRLLLSLAPDLAEALSENAENAHEAGTAFTHAIRRMRDERYLEALLAAGARPDARFAGHSPFALAAVLGNQSAMDFLSDRNLDTELNPTEQLLAAAARGDADSVRAQLQTHPELPAQLAPWDRLLHTELAKYDRRAAIVALLENGLCEIDAQGESQMTALHQAAWFGYADLIAALLEFAPNLKCKNMFGGTALDTAQYGAQFCRENRSGPADYERCIHLLRSAATT